LEAQKGPNEISTHEIRPNPHQPRRTFDEAGLRELADSLVQHGFLQPVVVRATTSGYELIAGERRWRAARLAGLATVPATIRTDVADAEMLELALVENVQRAELDAIERAQAFQAMVTELGLTQEAVAKKVGLQRTTVTNHLRLLELPEEVQGAVSKGLLSMGHARALLAIATKQRQLELLGRIVREGLSVRQVEGMARGEPKVAPSAERAGALVPRKSWVSDLEARLRERLGTKVVIRNGKGYRGQIVIEYFDQQALDRTCEIIAPAGRVE
jgi:ParB family chromosome partitioning protein